MSGLNERARRQIALLAGDDLEGEQRDEARQYVDACPECRGHWLRLRGCLDVLERSGKADSPATRTSLWPEIESRLQQSVVVRRSDQFNGWVPALSMAAACIALLIAGQNDGVNPDRGAAYEQVSSQQMFPTFVGPRVHQRPFQRSSGMLQRFASFEKSFALPKVDRSWDESLERSDLMVPDRSPLPGMH